MIAYRSPAGRVAIYSETGQLTERHEPGPAADAVWSGTNPDLRWPGEARRIDKEEPMNEKNTTPKAKRARRQSKAALMEERLNQVLDEIEKAQVELCEQDPEIEGSVRHIDAARACDHLAKAMVIGNGGDLLAWYRERVGV